MNILINEALTENISYCSLYIEHTKHTHNTFPGTQYIEKVMSLNFYQRLMIHVSRTNPK